MKTILDTLIAAMPENTFAGVSSVWNIHMVNWKELMANKTSNIHRHISDKSIFSDEYLNDGVTIFVGAKGRSQHSATDLIIFRGDHSDYDTTNGHYWSYKDLVELGIRS